MAPSEEDNAASGQPDHTNKRVVLPSLDEVLRHIYEASRSGLGLRGTIRSHDLGSGVALFVLDSGEPGGLLAQIADLPSIYLMTARHLNIEAAASVLADEVMEPSDNWVRIDLPTAESLLSGNMETIDQVFGA